MIRPTPSSTIHSKSFFAVSILVTISMAINMFVFERFLINTIAPTQATIYVFTLISSALLLASILDACTCIIMIVLKRLFKNYTSKTSLTETVVLALASCVCLCFAFSMLEPFLANTTLFLIMCLEVPILAVFIYSITLIYNIESNTPTAIK